MSETIPICAYAIPGGSSHGGTIEGWADAHRHVMDRYGWSLDGTGYLTVPADGVSPELASAAGCTPVHSWDRRW